MNGRITTFFEDKGFGFITDENGDNRYFHVIKVANPEMIKKGAEVTFEPTTNTKGLSAFAVKVAIESKYIFIANERIKRVRDKGDDDDVPDRHPERNSRQVVRRGVTGHGHIDHRHAHVGELADQDGPCQRPQGGQFSAGVGAGECRGWRKGACSGSGHVAPILRGTPY